MVCLQFIMINVMMCVTKARGLRRRCMQAVVVKKMVPISSLLSSSGDPDHRHRFLKRFNISGGSKNPEAFNLTTLDKPRQSDGCSAAAALCLRRQPEANEGSSRSSVSLRGGKVVGFEIRTVRKMFCFLSRLANHARHHC